MYRSLVSDRLYGQRYAGANFTIKDDTNRYRILIDTMDAGTKLMVVLERETRFLVQINLMSVQERRKTTLFVTPFAWLLQHGRIARSNEVVFEGITSILKNWKQGDFYMESRHWEREGMQPHPYEIDYCSMTGEYLKE
jgi:hypothetical protein